MKRLLSIAALVFLNACASSVTVVHFTDYHSHAVPFYARGERDAAGIARAFAYVEPMSHRDDVIVLNGGDTMNRGAPPWSDKFKCVEWQWWNGVVDAMAYGNHDADYGPTSFADCQAGIDYPILGANVLDGDGRPLFLHEGKPFLVLERHGKRVGIFAVTGSDFSSLVRRETLPADGASFAERVASAREVVRGLREDERVDAVVLFGHAHNEEDEALARAVPGIDLVLGTHSHKATPLRRIEGTMTWMIASGQYLENVSRVEIVFGGRGVSEIKGELVPMTADRPEDSVIVERVRSLQRELESDPDYATLFEPIGRLESNLSNDGVNGNQTDLGRFVMDAVRKAAGADIALSTSSSFRGSLPSGSVRRVDLLDVLPYDNAVLVFEMSSSEVRSLLERARSLRGSDSFIQVSGIDLDAVLDPARRWKVATTDYVARVSPQWKGLFASSVAVEAEQGLRSMVEHAIAGDQ